MKDINTFRIRKSTFEDVWETNFLIFILNPLMDITLKVLDVSKPPEEMKDDQKKMVVFDRSYAHFMKIIKEL